MNIIEFIRLIIKHIRLLILAPIVLAVLVILLTINRNFKYSSQTMLYTGLASGSSIEMEKTFNYFATNTAFDNLINIINSRETQEEVAIRLLTQHLMLPKSNPRYISKKLYDEFKLKIPSNIYNYIEKSEGNDASKIDSIGTYYKKNPLFPREINPLDYEKTVENLTNLMKSSNDNFIYEILNYEDKHYSLRELSKILAIRINSSDLVKLSFTTNDPGICQQTLAIYNEVCIKNYKNIKENRSDAVVKYFEEQLLQANEKLKQAEDKLLEFNKSYNIINYYEQSKAVAVVKEDMEVDYNNKKAKLAGTIAATKKIEEKLEIQKKIQLLNNDVLEKKRKLGDLNYEIALTETMSGGKKNEVIAQKLSKLTYQKNQLNEDIRKQVDEIYTFENSIEGIPRNKALPEWMDNVIETETLKASIGVMDQRNKDFREQYAIYAPAGANIKRIEREISVSEQGYLEILHGLNLAKLKLQDNELSSNLKAIDSPYYPLTPIPGKRKILVAAALFLGVFLILAIILIMEFFDNTLKNSHKASKILGLKSFGMMPKILYNPGNINFQFIQKRLIEIITQNITQFLSTHPSESNQKIMTIFSTQKMEGKTVLAGNILKVLKNEGKKVLFLTYSDQQERLVQSKKTPLINKILGYPDPRVDTESPFLAPISSYLKPSEYKTYALNEQFYKAENYNDILSLNNIQLDFTPDFVIIELPAMIYNNYPTSIISNSDLNILTCRSNRSWVEADKTILENLEQLSPSKIGFILNGVQINEVEAVLGDLPKERSSFRKKLKEIFKFQFFSKNQI